MGPFFCNLTMQQLEMLCRVLSLVGPSTSLEVLDLSSNDPDPEPTPGTKVAALVPLLAPPISLKTINFTATVWTGHSVSWSLPRSIMRASYTSLNRRLRQRGYAPGPAGVASRERRANAFFLLHMCHGYQGRLCQPWCSWMIARSGNSWRTLISPLLTTLITSMTTRTTPGACDTGSYRFR